VQKEVANFGPAALRSHCAFFTDEYHKMYPQSAMAASVHTSCHEFLAIAPSCFTATPPPKGTCNGGCWLGAGRGQSPFSTTESFCSSSAGGGARFTRRDPPMIRANSFVRKTLCVVHLRACNPPQDKTFLGPNFHQRLLPSITPMITPVVRWMRPGPVLCRWEKRKEGGKMRYVNRSPHGIQSSNGDSRLKISCGDCDGCWLMLHVWLG
jgi:hypothetical protein